MQNRGLTATFEIAIPCICHGFAIIISSIVTTKGAMHEM
jgi:hypothetical protein